MDLLGFSKPELWVTKQSDKLENLEHIVSQELLNEWQRFLQTEDKKMKLRFDRITGKPSIIEGEGIHWIPGWVNNIKGPDLGLPEGVLGKDVPVEIVKQKAIDLLKKYPKLFNINQSFLKLNLNASGPISDYLYNIRFDFYYFNIPIEKAHLSFHLNNGNLVQFGQEYICDSIYELDPNPKINIEDAWNILWNYIGGKNQNDEIIEQGRLSIAPISTEEVLAGNYVSPGTGLKYKLIYTISFIRKDLKGTWEGKIDAHTGEILSFIDANLYGHIQGGVCLHNNISEVIMPFPYAKLTNTSDPDNLSDSLGNFFGDQGTCKLKGQYVEIMSGSDIPFTGSGCNDIYHDNEIILSAEENGLIDFLKSPANDCSTPLDQDGNPIGGIGNTKAARTQYWYITKIKIKLLKYQSSNLFLKMPYVVSVNNKSLCNAAFYPLKYYIICYSSVPGYCQNSGEFPSISIHEFGHGLDCFDNFSNNKCNISSPAEATADWISTLEFRDSCIGRGYYTSLGYTCPGFGDPCDSCTGSRDADYMMHNSDTPWTVKNNREDQTPNINKIWGPCGSGNYNGPCGWQDHCESGIATQALWDLVNRELIKFMDLPSAWQLTERLFYKAMPNITKMYSCNNENKIYNTDGCDINSLFNQLKVADDDDGNTGNGTPHASEIFNALNIHGIACGTADDQENKSFSICPNLSQPYLYGFSTSGQNNLYWNQVENATKYVIYRNEISCNIGFTRVFETTNTCYEDADIYPGITYYYRIEAFSQVEACTGGVSNCISLTAFSNPEECPAPGPPTLLKAEGLCDGIELKWAPWQCGNSIRYNIYRREGDCRGSFTKIAGPITGTTYKDTNVTIGKDYSYKIKASCDTEGSVESPSSNCLTGRKLPTPATPEKPTIEDICNGLKVSWKEVSGATRYNVLRRNGGCGNDGWGTIASNIEGTEYRDTNAQPGGTYGYSIEALNDCGKSRKSDCSSGTHSAPDISGIVKEIVYDKTKIPTPPPIERPVQGAKIKDLTGQMNYEAKTNSNGYYVFQDVQGSTYHLHAYVVWTIDGVDYEIGYSPLPYRSVPVCKVDVLNQDFWKEVWVVSFRGAVMGPIYIGGIFNNWTVSAYSANYFTTTITNIEGRYTLLLPSGIYRVSARKDCYVSYPPYLTQTVGDSPISNINFQITDWQICDNCYATLYREQKECGLLIDPDICLNNSITKFRQCAYLKTQDANSYFYNAIILSVEVQRAKGKPEWQSYNFLVQEEGDYFINLTNGDLFNQETAVSSAEVNLEPYGELFKPSDFNKNVFQLKKQLHLTPGTYTLNAILRSQPGSYITIVISNKDLFSFPELP